jgi:hypothetical protein
MPDIDPREFGRLEAEVKALSGQVADLQADVKTLLELANKGKGTLWTIAGFAGIFGGAGSLLIEKLFRS